MLEIITISVFGFIMLASAILAITTKKLLVAIIASGVISLLASIIYLILQSPDVAMTEAAIGSALTTMVFLFALRRIKRIKKGESDD